MTKQERMILEKAKAGAAMAQAKKLITEERKIVLDHQKKEQ